MAAIHRYGACVDLTLPISWDTLSREMDVLKKTFEATIFIQGLEPPINHVVHFETTSSPDKVVLTSFFPGKRRTDDKRSLTWLLGDALRQGLLAEEQTDETLTAVFGTDGKLVGKAYRLPAIYSDEELGWLMTMPRELKWGPLADAGFSTMAIIPNPTQAAGHLLCLARPKADAKL